MFMIDYKELSWWYWFVTACLLTAGIAGSPAGFSLAIGLTVIQLIHFTLRERSVPLTQMLAKEGTVPEVGTIVYIHGIGNKPVASVLKCQWDSVLFGAPMGDRTRLAYWVDRDRYPVLCRQDNEAGTASVRFIDDAGGPGDRVRLRAVGLRRNGGWHATPQGHRPRRKRGRCHEGNIRHR